jgi:SPP1 family predicted phage head-tail adaptor
MRAGKLRHRVILQSRSDTQDETGSAVPAWANVATVYAAVEPLRGRELLTAQSINSEVTGTIRMRYRAGIDASMRATYGGKTYNIVAVVNPEERNIELLLYTSQGLNDG